MAPRFTRLLQDSGREPGYSLAFSLHSAVWLALCFLAPCLLGLLVWVGSYSGCKISTVLLLNYKYLSVNS